MLTTTILEDNAVGCSENMQVQRQVVPVWDRAGPVWNVASEARLVSWEIKASQAVKS